MPPITPALRTVLWLAALGAAVLATGWVMGKVRAQAEIAIR